MEPQVARYLWQLIEPYHAVTYFAPNAIETYERAGLKGGWMGYFAGRSAAMGPVSAGVVTATFYNFHPAMVERSIPDAWSFSTPEKALDARLEIADHAIRHVVGEEVPGADEATDLLTRVVESADPSGRPLFAAHAALPRPDEPHLALWWACSALREHRGDGHVACLTHASLDGCEANVMAAAIGALKSSTQKKFRGWSDEEWDDGIERLHGRGLVDRAGEATAEGRALKDQVEADTDRLAAAPFGVLSDEDLRGLIGLLEPVTGALVGAGAIRYPNPMGLTAPARPA